MSLLSHKDVKEAVIDPETGLVAAPPDTFWRIYKKKLVLSEEEAFRIALIKRVVTKKFFVETVSEETLVDIPVYGRYDISYRMLKDVIADTGRYDYRILNYQEVYTLDEDALIFNSIVALNEYKEKVARAAVSNDRFLGDYPPKTVKGEDNGKATQNPQEGL